MIVSSKVPSRRIPLRRPRFTIFVIDEVTQNPTGAR